MNTKPLIVAFTTSYFPYVGGVETSLRQIVQRLSNQFEFLIITGRYNLGNPRCEDHPDKTIWRIGTGHFYDKWLLPLSSVFLKHRYSKLNLRQERLLLWGLDITQASLAAALIRGTDTRSRLLLTIQYGESEARLARGRWGMIQRSFRFMLAQADHVTAISTSLVRIARAYGYHKPVELIPNGIDLKIFNPPTYRKRGPRPSIVSVSRLVRKNGVDVLLQAVALLKESEPVIECTIIGDGPERESLKALAVELDLQDHVRFLGELNHDAIIESLQHSDVFVRPSRSEGMGNAFIEAMGCGLPVVGTDVGGIGDLIIDGETGLLANVDQPADLAKKIRALLIDRNLAMKLATNAEVLVRSRYDLEIVSARYAAAFEKLLGL